MATYNGFTVDALLTKLREECGSVCLASVGVDDGWVLKAGENEFKGRTKIHCAIQASRPFIKKWSKDREKNKAVLGHLLNGNLDAARNGLDNHGN